MARAQSSVSVTRNPLRLTAENSILHAEHFSFKLSLSITKVGILIFITWNLLQRYLDLNSEFNENFPVESRLEVGLETSFLNVIWHCLFHENVSTEVTTFVVFVANRLWWDKSASRLRQKRKRGSSPRRSWLSWRLKNASSRATELPLVYQPRAIAAEKKSSAIPKVAASDARTFARVGMHQIRRFGARVASPSMHRRRGAARMHTRCTVYFSVSSRYIGRYTAAGAIPLLFSLSP